MDKKLRVRIITPETVKYDDAADMVIMRCATGNMGILPGHMPCSAVLRDSGVTRIILDGGEHWVAVYGGIAQVANDNITILTAAAEWPEEIDLAVAQAEREDAERRLRENLDNIEIQSNQVSLRRALVRIEVSSYPIISRKGSQWKED